MIFLVTQDIRYCQKYVNTVSLKLFNVNINGGWLLFVSQAVPNLKVVFADTGEKNSPTHLFCVPLLL